MRGRTKVISLAAMLLVIITSSMVFASGLLDPSRISLLGYTPIQPNQAPTIFIDPDMIIVDYVNDPGYQIGDTLLIPVNVTDITDLFTYQVNVTWKPSMLHYIGVVYGDFLARTLSPHGTSRIAPTVLASNVTGFASIAETILGNVGGITGAGRLFTIQFEIMDYGVTDLGISAVGRLATKLLDSTGAEMAVTSVGGYFKNKLFGDSNGDHGVTAADVGTLSDYWGSPPGLYPYNRDVDQIHDGVISAADVGIVSDNWLRSVVP
jgi:hypothetical protein